VRLAEEYLCGVQLGVQRLNLEATKLICEFLGSDCYDKRWVNPITLTDATHLVDQSMNGRLLS
jgi:hypothetical protein